jgi:hypothetical protein
VKELHRLDIAHITNIEHTHILQHFIYQFVLLPYSFYLEHFASKRASSQSLYPCTLFLFSIQCISSRESHGSGNRTLFLHLHIPLAAAAVLIWRLCSGRRGCHIVLGLCVSLRAMVVVVFLQERNHRTMRSLNFAHKDVEERVPSKKVGWEELYLWIKSDRMDRHTILYWSSSPRGLHILDRFASPSKCAYYGLQKVIGGRASRRSPPAPDCES